MRKGSISRQKHYFVSPKLFLLFSRHPVLIPLTKVQKIDLTGVTQFFGDPVVYIAPTNKDRNRHLKIHKMSLRNPTDWRQTCCLFRRVA